MSFLLSAALAQAIAVVPTKYRCLDDTRFTLTMTTELAVVRFDDREYRLPKRQSAIAIKFASNEATLYLDGKFAAFIAEDRPLPGCFIEEGSQRPQEGD